MTASGYESGKTIEQVTREQFRSLLGQARDGGLDDEAAAGSAQFAAYQFTLSGGGPGSDVVFLLDRPLEEGGEVREGFFSYYEPGGTHVVPFGASDGQTILDGLTSAVDGGDL